MLGTNSFPTVSAGQSLRLDLLVVFIVIQTWDPSGTSGGDKDYFLLSTASGPPPLDSRVSVQFSVYIMDYGQLRSGSPISFGVHPIP